jgi:mannose-6-phosphate isomerase-like protein (cupin superfamily)
VGGEVFPHTHPTHEFYFVMTGEGVMTIGEEQRDVVPGDLVYIPPDAVHSLRPTGGEPIHCFCFAVGVKGAAPIDYTTH